MYVGRWASKRDITERYKKQINDTRKRGAKEASRFADDSIKDLSLIEKIAWLEGAERPVAEIHEVSLEARKEGFLWKEIAIQCRKSMKEIIGKGQRKVHFNNESDSRRKSILSQIADTNVRSIIYSSSCANDIEARFHCFSELVKNLPGLKCNRLVVESRDSQDHRDKKWFYAQRSRLGHHVNFIHLQAHAEPLLWVADAVGWCYGRGGQWRKRITDLELVDSVIEVD